MVQFDWFCEGGGDIDEALTWRIDLLNLFLPKDVYVFIFLSRAPRSPPLSLADVFENNEKKNKTTSVYRMYVCSLL